MPPPSTTAAAEPDDPDQVGTVRLLWLAGLADLRSAQLRQLVALVTIMVWLVFEWGPGNEVAVPTILMAVLNRIDGPEAIIIMPIVGFALGVGMQLLSGLIAAVGFSTLENTAQAAWLTLRRWRPASHTKDFLALGWVARWGVAFFVGTTAVVLIQLFTTGEAKMSRHLRAIWISAALVGATISSLSGLVATAVVLGRRFAALEPYVDRLVETLANPLFWLVLLSVGLVGSEAMSRLRSSGEPD